MQKLPGWKVGSGSGGYVFGTQKLTNLVIPALRQQGEGRIIQLSSMLGIVCFAYRGA